MYSWSEEGGAITSAGAWGAAFAGLHGASRIEVASDAAEWSGRLDWQRSGTYGLALCAGGRETVTRQARHIRSDPRGTYELLVPLAGTAWVEQGAASTELRPGAMALCDIDRPLVFAHDSDFVSIAFIVTGQDVAVRSPAAARGPHLLDSGRGLGRVVRQLAVTVQEERVHLSEAAFDIACDRLLDLVCLAAEGGSDTVPVGQRAVVEAEIRRYVRRHACEADLDVSAIARALGWSARYVQQVLQAAGTTPRRLIRQERLNIARTRLGSAGWAEHPIADIAHSCGFGSHAAFATAFREEFGMTPRDARFGARPPFADPS